MAELIADLRSAAPRVKVLLVGAAARDLLLFYAHSIRATRATADIDLALAVADWNDFDRLRDSLLSSGIFTADTKVTHKLRYRQRLEVDLIPFGGVERADGTIAWPPEGDSVMRVLGFQEARASSVSVSLPLGLVHCAKCDASWQMTSGLSAAAQQAVVSLVRANRMIEAISRLRAEGFDLCSSKATIYHIPRTPGMCHRCSARLASEGRSADCPRCRAFNICWC